MLNNISSFNGSTKASNISFESRRYIPDTLLTNKDQGELFCYTPRSGDTFSIELKSDGHNIKTQEGDHFEFSQRICDMGSAYDIGYDITTKPINPVDIDHSGGIEVVSAKTKEGNEVGEKRLDVIWESMLAALTRPRPNLAQTLDALLPVIEEPKENKVITMLKKVVPGWN